MSVVEGGKTIEVFTDAGNEQVVIAAAMVDRAQRTALVRMLPVADFFLTPEHAAIWNVMLELERRNLDWDAATAKRIDSEVDVQLLAELADARPEATNVEYHVEQMLWDRQKATALQGPINTLLELLRDKKADRDRIDAVARQVGATLRGTSTRYVRDPRELTREVIANLRQRFTAGQAVYPYGLDGLDYFETHEAAREAGYAVHPNQARVRRCVPGTKPKQTTIITALSGSGKTTLIANLVLGIATQRRKVLIGSWEVNSALNLELIAVISLAKRDKRFTRTTLMEGIQTFDDQEEMFSLVHERVKQLQRYVRFMDNPFFKIASKGKTSNDSHLDIFGQAISDSGCEVVIADIWNRMLADERPEAEQKALTRQQAIFEELNVHGVISVQQRLKDVEQRADKKPTREGIKGSSAYVEIADTILAPYRPAQWKQIEDNRLEIYGLKQRWSKWPWGVALDYDPHTGVLCGSGRSLLYDLPTGSGETGETFLDTGFAPRGGGGAKRRAR